MVNKETNIQTENKNKTQNDKPHRKTERDLQKYEDAGKKTKTKTKSKEKDRKGKIRERNSRQKKQRYNQRNKGDFKNGRQFVCDCQKSNRHFLCFFSLYFGYTFNVQPSDFAVYSR